MWTLCAISELKNVHHIKYNYFSIPLAETFATFSCAIEKLKELFEQKPVITIDTSMNETQWFCF